MSCYCVICNRSTAVECAGCYARLRSELDAATARATYAETERDAAIDRSTIAEAERDEARRERELLRTALLEEGLREP